LVERPVVLGPVPVHVRVMAGAWANPYTGGSNGFANLTILFQAGPVG
jgi:hypothetical protein